MRVLVAYAAPGVEALLEVELAAGARVEDAVRVSGLLERHGIDPDGLSYGIHGRRAAPDAPLAEGDRVEILRPLRADPKTIRRRRAADYPLPRPPNQVKARKRP